MSFFSQNDIFEYIVGEEFIIYIMTEKVDFY